MNVNEAYEKLNSLLPENLDFVMFTEEWPLATLDGQFSSSDLRAIAEVLDELTGKQ